jgi:hypothetical protein
MENPARPEDELTESRAAWVTGPREREPAKPEVAAEAEASARIIRIIVNILVNCESAFCEAAHGRPNFPGPSPIVRVRS